MKGGVENKLLASNRQNGTESLITTTDRLHMTIDGQNAVKNMDQVRDREERASVFLPQPIITITLAFRDNFLFLREEVVSRIFLSCLFRITFRNQVCIVRTWEASSVTDQSKRMRIRSYYTIKNRYQWPGSTMKRNTLTSNL